MDPSLQSVLGLLTGLGSSTTRLQRIDDFNAFILNHIPYGQVSIDSLQTALIEYDGPAVNPTKQPLQWHFGGLPYAIDKAVRLDYSYTRSWDGSGSTVNASILLGFQSNAGSAPANGAATLAPASFAARVSNQITPTSTEQDIAAAVLLAMPTTIISGSAGFNDISNFLQTELGYEQVNALRQTVSSFEFDGPAQNNDSHDPFTYTLGTLFNNQDKYNQLLWWYFGGKANRVTKAIRIPLRYLAGSAPQGGAGIAASNPAPGAAPRRTRRLRTAVAQDQPSQSQVTAVPVQSAQQSAAQPTSPLPQQDVPPAPPPATRSSQPQQSQPQLSLLVGFTGPGSFP
jgi:hypothetical protein